MKTLSILRHAKAEAWTPGRDDFPRRLTARGRSHADAVADWVSGHLDLPDAILCSPANRARETLSPLLAAHPELESVVRFVPQIYGASTRTLQTLIDHAFTEADHVMIVGHNPGFEQLMFEVLSEPARGGIDRLRTGTLAVVGFPSGWPADAGNGKLLHVVRGKDLLKAD
jgi:phosphohistidine phosphatase SixA